MDVQAILELMKEMKSNDIASLDWEADGQKLQLSRPTASFDPAMLESLSAIKQQASLNLAGAAGRQTDEVSAETNATSDILENSQPKGRTVTSPVVGVFYAAASPEDDPFATVGGRVEAGSALGIIEAMKLMNEVVSPCSGTIVEILIDNSQRVEYGQPLFVIEESLS